MGRERIAIVLLLVVLYAIGSIVLTRRAMKHFIGPADQWWNEAPTLRQEFFAPEGRKHIRVARIYNTVGIVGLIVAILILNALG